MTYPCPEHARPKSKKARRREHRAAHRAGYADVTEYRRWLEHRRETARRQAHYRRRRSDHDG